MNSVIKKLVLSKLKVDDKARKLKKKKATKGTTNIEDILLYELVTEQGLIETAINILKDDRRFK